MKAFIFFCLCLFSSIAAAQHTPFPFFIPPEGWLMASSEHAGDAVKIGFVESERRIFTPALSLSIETISCDEKTYLDAVKRNHRADPSKSIRELGLLQTSSGKAHLLQIDLKNTWGKIRILQSILIKDSTAYIQTASCLREDFLKIHQKFLESFRSLTVSDNLLTSIKDKKEFQDRLSTLKRNWNTHLAMSQGEKEELFKAPSFQKKQWIPFTNYVASQLTENGVCWQLLALEHIKEQLIDDPTIH